MEACPSCRLFFFFFFFFCFFFFFFFFFFFRRVFVAMSVAAEVEAVDTSFNFYPSSCVGARSPPLASYLRPLLLFRGAILATPTLLFSSATALSALLSVLSGCSCSLSPLFLSLSLSFSLWCPRLPPCFASNRSTT